jgi:DNA polymerase-3 subunit beta
MKFNCTQQSLSKALNIVSKAVTARTTIPILKGILLNVTSEGKLILSASDLDISIEKTINDVNVIEEGSVVVQAKLFTDIIRKLPNEDVLVELKEDQNIIIKTSTSEFNILGISPDEFPKIGEMEEEEKLVFEKDIFKEMIKKSAFSASIDDSKGVIVGVLIELEDNNTNMVALDGFRMAVVREEMKNEKQKKIIISAKILSEINKILSDIESDEDVNFVLGKNKAILNFENIKIVIRLLDGEFIKYKDILPKDKNCRVVVRKDILHDSMERASLLSKEGKNNLIKIKVEEDLLTITSRSDEGNVREEIYVKRDGSDVEIGFNSKYILDVLKVIEDEEVVLEMVSSVKPCVIKPVEGNKFEYLVLPVRIS